MAFAALKSVTDGCIPYKETSTLELGTYDVKSFSKRPGKYGDCIRVYIDDFYIVLPHRFLDVINKPNMIDELNSGTYQMIYKGKKDEKKNAFVQIEFVQVKPSEDS